MSRYFLLSLHIRSAARDKPEGPTCLYSSFSLPLPVNSTLSLMLSCLGSACICVCVCEEGCVKQLPLRRQIRASIFSLWSLFNALPSAASWSTRLHISGFPRLPTHARAHTHDPVVLLGPLIKTNIDQLINSVPACSCEEELSLLCLPHLAQGGLLRGVCVCAAGGRAFASACFLH